MRIEVTLSQTYLPQAEEAEVIFLIRLLPEAKKKMADQHFLDIIYVLDRSGSMDDESGSKDKNGGSISKLEALKEAVKQSFGILRSEKDRIAVLIYDDTMDVIINPQVVNDISALKNTIDRIGAGGMTNLSSALRYAVGLNTQKDALAKIIVFTDGIVNIPSVAGGERECVDLAREANKKGIPFAVFGTGIDYNETFLKKLAEVAGRGSYYKHVSQVGMVKLELEEDFENLKSVQARDVEIQIEAGKDVTLIEASKYVPQQAQVPSDGYMMKDNFQGLDVRGQSYLLRARVRSNNMLGAFPVATYRVSWKGVTGPENVYHSVEVQFTDDPRLVSPVDKTVRNTVLNTEAVKATLGGQYSRAETLFEMSGNTAMSEQVKTLAVKDKDEDAKRTLRTKTVSDAHKGTIINDTKTGGKS